MMGQYRSPEIEFGPLADLPRAELATRWRSYYRVDPPKGISRQLLVRAIAYQMQAKRYGALKPASLRRLHKVLQGDDIGNKAGTDKTAKLHPGARLVREWNGISHVVEVIEGGFIWNGEQYASLSAIARAITSARWSGPRFFGLTSDDAP